MPLRMTTSDLELLKSLAEYRFLSIRQIAFLHRRNLEGALRRLRGLEGADLIQSIQLSLTGRQGRPEKLFGVTDAAIALLVENGLTPTGTLQAPTPPTRTASLVHDHWVSWFLLHLLQIERTIKDLNTAFIRSVMPVGGLQNTDNIPNPRRRVSGATVTTEAAIVPDAVFMIRSTSQAKTLLFFLEVDMGSEPLKRQVRGGSDIHQKIVTYQQYFHSGAYKDYESSWPGPFEGFRVLFLAADQNRLANLCTLVRNTPPSNFVWLTSRDQILAEGLSARIWARGGNDAEAPKSILGDRLACRAPITHPDSITSD